MQALTLTIPVGSQLPGESFRVMANVDSAGKAAADLDMAITGRGAVLFWPGVRPLSDHLAGAWLSEPWLSMPSLEAGHLNELWISGRWMPDPDSVFDHIVRTPPLYFGRFRFAVHTYDRVGNVAGEAPSELEILVNSGPRPAQRFRQTDVSGGLPVFAFDPPTQFGEL